MKNGLPGSFSSPRGPVSAPTSFSASSVMIKLMFIRLIKIKFIKLTEKKDIHDTSHFYKCELLIEILTNHLVFPWLSVVYQCSAAPSLYISEPS